VEFRSLLGDIDAEVTPPKETVVRRMILIVSRPKDPHAALVTERLRQKGAEVALACTHEIPARCGVSAWASDERRLAIKIARGEQEIDLERVDTIWFRRLEKVEVDGRLEGDDRRFAEWESFAFAMSLGAALSDRFCVNPVLATLATDRGLGKLHQLELARRLGMHVPKTLATNEPARARAFLVGCARGAIYKPFYAPLVEESVEGKEQPQLSSILTTEMNEATLEQLEGVRLAPAIFQEFVPKRLELRVNVIGQHVFSTEIHSQLHEGSRVDSRMHYFELHDTPYAPHTLPKDLEERCRALNRELGLVFGAYDFILTPDGRYVFLEVNPQGQFLWIEQITGQPLLEAFCEMLLQRTPAYRCDLRLHEPRPWHQPEDLQ
jgi:glutathione synthase/RimK-type ligase-like ATP-grasp enzyme